MEEIWRLGAVRIAGMIRRGEISSSETVEAFLRRIEAVNPAINAVVALADSAADEARLADEALARGEVIGPLHGVPFTAKDIFLTAGVETSAGLTERVGLVPSEDAVTVARMRRAGAILLGKTNVPPGGNGGVTDNPIHGRTNNPHDIERTPGGSSGGEAAIQGAGGSPVGLGSDSGGSLRVPAHYCGVAALKPTTGRVPSTGVIDLPGGLSDPRSQIGPMSRYVQDLGTVLEVIAGPDGRDSGVAPVALGHGEEGTLASLHVAFYADDGCTPPSDQTARAVGAAADALASAGARVTQACPTGIGETSWDLSVRYWGWEELPGGDSVKLLSDWDAFRTRMLMFMDRFDVIVCPAAPGPAPAHGDGVETMFRYTLPFSLTGQPCAVVPCGFSDDGMPIGVQVVAGVWRDKLAVAVAGCIEDASGGWHVPVGLR